MKTNQAEETKAAEQRAKLGNWMMIGGALMGAGTLLMTFAAQSWFTVSLLLWSAGAVITFPASCRLFKKFEPLPSTPQQENRLILALVMVNTATCAVGPFLLRPSHPHLSMSQIFAVSAIVWLMMNVLFFILIKIIFGGKDK